MNEECASMRCAVNCHLISRGCCGWRVHKEGVCGDHSMCSDMYERESLDKKQDKLWKFWLLSLRGML